MYRLQTSVIINDKEYHITDNGDFRMVLDCFSALNDEELSEDYRVLASLLIFYNEFNSLDDLATVNDILPQLASEMYLFFNCGQEKIQGVATKHTLVDWDSDSQIICSAINKVAGYEVREKTYVHWWTFMGYYLSIGNSLFANVVSIRDKIVNHKKLEKWEKEFRRDNPDYFNWRSTTAEERELEKNVLAMWNSGGGK